MGHGIESDDDLVVVGEPAWHGLGRVVPRQEGIGVREAAREVLPWDVEVRCAKVLLAPCAGNLYKRVVDAPGQVVIRVDPPSLEYDSRETPLAVVGSGFVPYPNSALIDFLAEVSEVHDLPLETLGSIQGGRKVFGLLNLGTYDAGGGETSKYLAVLNGHDTSRAFRCFGTSVRVVCANTEALAESAGEGVGFRGVHDSALAGRVAAFGGALAGGLDALHRAEEEDRALIRRQVWTREMLEYFRGIYSLYTGREYPFTDPKDKHGERELRRAEDTIGEFFGEFERDRSGPRGTAYAALQSVTRWVNHGRPRVRDHAGDVLHGAGSRLTRGARAGALELLG